MNKSRILVTILLLAASFLFASTSSAQVTESDKKLGRVAWSAFSCSSWASIKDDEAETTRLFNIGYESGHRFITLLHKYDGETLNADKYTPIGFMFALQGPSVDFMLGRVYSAAQDSALEEVYKTGDVFNDDARRKSIAANKYLVGNCELIQ